MLIHLLNRKKLTGKATLAYASVFGLVKDTNLVGHEYSWLGAIVYLAQLVAQPVIAYILVKFPLGKFMAATTFFWGVSLTCMTAAHNFEGLLVSRLFLGLFEAGVAPAFIALTQTYWRRREQPVRLGAWVCVVDRVYRRMLTAIVCHEWCDKHGGKSSYLGHWSHRVVHVEGIPDHLPLFRCKYCLLTPKLFTNIERLITVAYSVVVFFFLPDSPMKARFLDEDEKLVAIERMRANQQGIENDTWKWEHVKEAVIDFKTWGWAAMMFSISVPSGGISTFGPLIIKAFGYDSFETILFNIPFGAVQLIATMGGAWVATKIGMKAPVLAFLSLPPIAGCVMLLFLPRAASAKAPLLVAYYLISVYPGITPLIYSWSAANTAGETKKKVTTGMLFIFQCAGNVLGPNLYTTGEAPLYRRGLLSNLALFIVLIGLYAAQAFYLFLMNKKHAKRRVAEGKNAKMVDRSMMQVKEAYDKKEIEDAAETGENAFSDMTDFENCEFVYVY